MVSQCRAPHGANRQHHQTKQAAADSSSGYLKISVEEPTICFLNTAAPSLSGEKQSVQVNKACLLLVRSPTSREALKVWLKQIEVQGKGRIPPCQTCFT